MRTHLLLLTTLPACRHRRKRTHPRTPDKYEVMSKRSWDGRIKTWRKALHKWTPSAESQAAEVLGDDANLEEIDAMLGELEDDDAAFGAADDDVDSGGGGGGGGAPVSAMDEEDGDGQDSYRYFDDELDETHLLE